MLASSLTSRFAEIVTRFESKLSAAGINVEDEDTDAEVRRWLDGNDTPVEWAGQGVTADEWFFVTTLYGTMTLDGQRTHIRKFFPLFVRLTNRDVRNFTLELLNDWRLRSGWMKTRLCRMAEVLRQTGQTMDVYVAFLRDIESRATPADPMPALGRLMRDQRAGEGKTLSVFIRDCVRGNCFPIDSRVKAQIEENGFPVNERLLVSTCLELGLNPRRTARMFYQVAGVA